MISAAERFFIEEHAYIPEQLPDYVTAVTQAEPILFDDFIVYHQRERIIIVGYSVSGKMDVGRLQRIIDQCRRIFDPKVISLIAPEIPPSLEGDCPASTLDNYYRLDLRDLRISKKLRSLLKRSARDVQVETLTRWGREHQRLVNEFMRARLLDEGTRYILKRLHKYVRSNTATLVEARDRRNRLVAFDIADFSAARYAFYMFNFLDREHAVPGASDLLLHNIIEQALKQGKIYLNMGLGINPGVEFFKLKWGASKFLPYCSCLLTSPEADDSYDWIGTLLK